mmetsp:Transcript_92840/g.200702  ORF Transcript_92840/g.200702 Transcript_92840/m.200702 type:complete len:262 (+) Transcript_92840:2-787(+)
MYIRKPPQSAAKASLARFRARAPPRRARSRDQLAPTARLPLGPLLLLPAVLHDDVHRVPREDVSDLLRRGLARSGGVLLVRVQLAGEDAEGHADAQEEDPQGREAKDACGEGAQAHDRGLENDSEALGRVEVGIDGVLNKVLGGSPRERPHAVGDRERRDGAQDARDPVDAVQVHLLLHDDLLIRPRYHDTARLGVDVPLQPLPQRGGPGEALGLRSLGRLIFAIIRSLCRLGGGGASVSRQPGAQPIAPRRAQRMSNKGG